MLLFQAIIATSFVYAISFAMEVALPLPDGPYGVTYATMELTNTKMLDPYASVKQDRRIMLSVFYPSTRKENCRPTRILYMPSATAAIHDQIYAPYGLPNGTFEALELNKCENDTSFTIRNLPHYPVVLFSPGLGDSRLLYSVIAESLAAQGFVVLTVDHPYDAAVVEFPDGSLVLAANISTIDQIEAALAVRTKDVSFVIGQLHNRTVTQLLFKGLYGTVDSRNILMYGHSLGGATAAAAMLEDGRIHGGINLDGTLFGSVIAKGLDRPFMLFAHEGKNQSTDQSWASIWPQLNGSKVEASVFGTTHASYQDFPILIDVLGLRDQLPPKETADLVGTIKGDRMIKVLTTYTSSFFYFVLGQSPSSLLRHSMAQFPDVAIANSTLVKG